MDRNFLLFSYTFLLFPLLVYPGLDGSTYFGTEGWVS